MMNRNLLFMTAVGILIAGCSGPLPSPTGTPTATAEPTITPTPTQAFPLPEGKMIFGESDEEKFSGTVYGQGKTAILLANMTRGGEAQWDPFVEAVDKSLFTTVTFNYLRVDYGGVAVGIQIVLEKMQSAGYQRVICIGASMGVAACGVISSAPEMVGIVMISGKDIQSSLHTATYPKLFITADRDPSANSIRSAYDYAAEPKELIIYPDNGAHGTELFYSSEYRDQFLKALIDFVERIG